MMTIERATGSWRLRLVLSGTQQPMQVGATGPSRSPWCQSRKEQQTPQKRTGMSDSTQMEVTVYAYPESRIFQTEREAKTDMESAEAELASQ